MSRYLERNISFGPRARDNWRERFHQQDVGQTLVENDALSVVFLRYGPGSDDGTLIVTYKNGASTDPVQLCTQLLNLAGESGQQINAAQCIDDAKQTRFNVMDEKVSIGGATIDMNNMAQEYGNLTVVPEKNSTNLDTTNTFVGAAILLTTLVMYRISTKVRKKTYNVSRPSNVVDRKPLSKSDEVNNGVKKNYNPKDEVVAEAIKRIGDRYDKGVDDPMVKLFKRTTQAQREEILRQHFSAAPELGEKAIKEFRSFIGAHGLDTSKWIGSGKRLIREEADYNIDRGAKAIDKADQLIMKYFFKIIGFR